MNHAITIGNTTIHQDEHGRYCLNDLHKAAGGLPKHRPAQWLRSQQTKELIEELSSVQIRALVSVNGGNARGSYVCDELVYAYAMWISAMFYLKVIRTYKALVTGQLALPELTVPLTEHLAQADEMGELRDENAALNKEVLGLYRSKSPVCKEKIVYRDRVPVKVVELMLRYNIPRELVSEACGRDRGHLRVINCNARKAGRLS